MALPLPAETEAPASADDRVEAFAEFLDRQEEENSTEGISPEDEDASDMPDVDAREQRNEPDDPAIAPPVSWDNDAKALFEQLPPELQEKVAAREAQRERAIQETTTAAAEARRNAAAEANAEFADQQRLYAAHLAELANQMAPQRPDPVLLTQDPQAFYRLQAQYESQVAQAEAMAQAAALAEIEAEQRDALNRHHELAQDHAALAAELGEDWTDASRRRALLTDLEGVGAALGYSMELMGQANATDILALKAAAEWKAKADRYDQLQSNRTSAVRAARNAPRVARPGAAPSRAEQSARGRDAAWARAKTERSGEAYAAMLDSIGIKL
jgi:hypothetical protein